MSRPVSESLLRVAVSQRVDFIVARNEWRDALDQHLVEWLHEVGALVFPVPNGLLSIGGLQPWLDAVSPQAIVLSGGNNIGENSARDRTEAALLDHAASFGLPLLGICRGMQMMGYYAGAALEQVSGHTGTRHLLLPISGAELPLEVNSYHDWCLANCPDDYTALAKSHDGSLEAIRHRHRSWEGWMWHPEREATFDPDTIARARNIFYGASY